MDDAPRAPIRGLGKQHEVKSVVVPQAEVREERVRTRRKLRASGLEVMAFRSSHDLAAGLPNHAADRPVGFGYQKPHLQVGLVRMAPGPLQLQDCCHGLEVSFGEEFLAMSAAINSRCRERN